MGVLKGRTLRLFLSLLQENQVDPFVWSTDALLCLSFKKDPCSGSDCERSLWLFAILVCVNHQWTGRQTGMKPGEGTAGRLVHDGRGGGATELPPVPAHLQPSQAQQDVQAWTLVSYRCFTFASTAQRQFSIDGRSIKQASTCSDSWLFLFTTLLLFTDDHISTYCESVSPIRTRQPS